MERFELSTPCSQSRCATKLRHIPVTLDCRDPLSLSVASTSLA